MELQDTTENIDVDQILAEVEKPADPRAMEGEPEAPEAPQEEKPWEPPEWSHFEWNGKKLFPDSPDKAKQWLSMGYNYSQRMGELNKSHAQRMAEVEAREKAYAEQEKKLAVYREVDQYAAQNKEWWDFVQQQFHERQQSRGLPPELSQHLAPVLSELQELKGWKQTWEEQQQQVKVQEEDQALEAEIKSLQGEFPNYDFSAVDPATGQTLELQILRYAADNKLPSFRAAAWAYLGPRIAADAKATGQMAAAKQVQAKAKAGIIGQTPTPTRQVTTPKNLKAMSWDDLHREALQELGIS